MSVEFRPQPATIESIDRQVRDNFVYQFRPRTGLRIAPGQFVEISVAGVGAFPVSPSDCGDGSSFTSCIRRAGRATGALYQLQEGDVVGLRGPFGNGFPLPAFSGRDVLLIAGGLGMAPLRGLLAKLLERRQDYGEIILLYGSREPAALLFRRELEDLGARNLLHCRFSVDFAAELSWATAGASCRVGLVTDLLEDLNFVPARVTAAVCGPPVLYGCVLEQLAGLGVAAERIFATLERRMKCGVGQCCHCATGGVFICRDGPVFSLERLRRIEGAIGDG